MVDGTRRIVSEEEGFMSNTVSLTIQPEGKSFTDIPWSPGMNVQTLMEIAYGIPPGYSFALQFFGALGYTVLMIDGTYDTNLSFWFLYINEVFSQTGIDQTFLNPGDAAALSFEPFTADKHVGEIHSTRYKAAQNASIDRTAIGDSP
jgi:hypothetical protein